MATRKKKKASGGLSQLLSAGVVLLVVVGGLMGFMRVNNINSIIGLYDYLKAWSQEIDSCGAGNAQWTCGPDGQPVPPSSGGGAPTAPGDGGQAPAPQVPAPPANSGSTTDKLSALNALAIAKADSTDYERSDWKHWTGSPCDTRKEILKAQGSNVVTDPATCKVTSGTWLDPYSLKTFTDASKLDIDHVIPLGYAALHGGNAWSPEMKQQFANDPSQLLAVDAGENRGKSDSGPEEYMPPNRDYACTYATIWVTTATKYQLSITEGDKFALKDALQKCG